VRGNPSSNTKEKLMGLDDIEKKVGPEAAKIEADAKQEAENAAKQNAPKYEQEGKDFAEKEAKDLKSRS
jgi:hypothetical protein